METGQHLAIDQMEFFRAFQNVADWCWDCTGSMSPFHLWTFGKQLVTAADAVCANLIEGDNRYTDPDKIHFFVMARASAQETIYWIRRAARQGCIDREAARRRVRDTISACKQLNSVISYRRANPWSVREERATYDAGVFEDAGVIENELR